MTCCAIHTDFFDDNCNACKKEYGELKGLNDSNRDNYKNSYHNDKGYNKKYKEFTEERAKRLYEDLILQYIKSSSNDIEAVEKAKGIIRKQCRIRDIPFWSWA